jgi:STE24 endopeptidase
MAEPAGPNHAPRNKEYNKIKLRLTVADILIDLVLIAAWAFSGISPVMADIIGRYISNEYFSFLAFIAFASVAYAIIDLPLDFYGGFIIEHRYNLSNQSVRAWITDKAKSAGIGACIGIPLALAFYFFLRATGDLWWLYFSLFAFFISVLLARLAPVIIYPLFYQFRELEPGEIRDTIMRLVDKEGIRIKGIFSFNLSKDTKKANAGFTGIGGSRRIILSDTLMEKFTPAEIGVVFAHEMGHYTMRHITKGILIGAAVIFLSFFLCGELYRATLGYFGNARVYDLAAIPILLFYLTLVGLVSMPLMNAISRRHERAADRYALDITGEKESFISTMDKLADMNLADKDPNPVTEFLFYSHPSIKKRIASAK